MGVVDLNFSGNCAMMLDMVDDSAHAVKPSATADADGPGQPIEDYALIGDCHTGALVGRNGSIDWLCYPRFDSPAVFSALLGGPEKGRWLLAPQDESATAERRYQDDTFILETTWTCATGRVRVTDFMPFADRRANLVRRVTGLEGTVAMRQELIMRFGYGSVLPWVRRSTDSIGRPCLEALAGPDAIALHGAIPHSGADHRHENEFEVAAGENVDVMLIWYPSYRDVPAAIDVDEELANTQKWWREWADRSDTSGPYADLVDRSLLVLRALSHEDTGGIVAAATTSLPEQMGGPRNWDYRYCWLRDASLTLDALMAHGYGDGAYRWRNWLLRAVAGDPDDVQIMYGIAGERELPERELDLPGYRGSSPVRVGNGAVDQYQGDVIGEVLVSLERARQLGVAEDSFSWPLQFALLEYVEENLDRKDSGIWEIRGELQHFTQSKAMAWAAFNSGVQAVEKHGLDGPADHWRALRDRVADQIMESGFDKERNTFTQYFGSTGVDASLLLLPQVGFCAYDDPRMLGTVAAMEEELLVDGLLLRYRTESNVDGLPPGECPFLACSFWLVEQYARSGRVDDARALMDRLVSFVNDVGLLSEEYDTAHKRQMGNTPQALSHLALVRAADALNAADAG